MDKSDIPDLSRKTESSSIISLDNNTNILDYVRDNYKNQTREIFRVFNSPQSPLGDGNVDNDFIYEINPINDSKWTKVLALDVRTNNYYVNTYRDGSWLGWSIFNNTESMRYEYFYSGTIYDLAVNAKTSKRYFMLNGYIPSDAPLTDSSEYFIDIMVDQTQSRKTVIAVQYNNGNIFHRQMFNNNWLTNWVCHNRYAQNSDRLQGHPETHFVKSLHYGVSDNDIRDANHRIPYIGYNVNSDTMPDTDWWHVIYMPHINNDGYGAQLAVGYHGQTRAFIRSAGGTTWGGWRMISSNTSAPVSIQSNAPSTSELWAY